jgi:hypothetical protein
MSLSSLASHVTGIPLANEIEKDAIETILQ